MILITSRFLKTAPVEYKDVISLIHQMILQLATVVLRMSDLIAYGDRIEIPQLNIVCFSPLSEFDARVEISLNRILQGRKVAIV